MNDRLNDRTPMTSCLYVLKTCLKKSIFIGQIKQLYYIKIY